MTYFNVTKIFRTLNRFCQSLETLKSIFSITLIIWKIFQYTLKVTENPISQTI